MIFKNEKGTWSISWQHCFIPLVEDENIPTKVERSDSVYCKSNSPNATYCILRFYNPFNEKYEEIERTLACCDSRDQFSKEIGRSISLGKLVKNWTDESKDMIYKIYNNIKEINRERARGKK